MYQRQASFRGLGQLAGATPFKRGGRGSSSLRPRKLASSHPASSAPDSLGSLNPWDSVADPPPAPSIPVSSAASSLTSLQPSSASADSWLQSLATAPPTASLLASCLQLEAGSKLSVEVAPSKSDTNTSSGYNSPSSSTHSAAGSWQRDVSKSILEDPFDAEWAAIATRTTPTPAPGSNPFLSPDPGPAPAPGTAP